MDEQDHGEGAERGEQGWKGGPSERQRREKNQEVPKNQQQKWEFWQETFRKRGRHGWKEWEGVEKTV